jgi:hypothetical protein
MKNANGCSEESSNGRYRQCCTKRPVTLRPSGEEDPPNDEYGQAGPKASHHAHAAIGRQVVIGENVYDISDDKTDEADQS